MNKNYKFSYATITDINRINTLVNSAYRGDSSRQGWTTEADLLDGSRITPELVHDIILSSDTYLLLYEVQGQLLGCVELRKEGTRLYLGMLTVEPKQQGKGIGKVLLKEANRIAVQLGCRSIYMSVISRRNELIDWYKRNGFHETGIRKPFQMPDERWGIPKMKLEFIYMEMLLG